MFLFLLLCAVIYIFLFDEERICMHKYINVKIMNGCMLALAGRGGGGGEGCMQSAVLSFVCSNFRV